MASVEAWAGEIINRLLNWVVWPVFVGVVIGMFLWAGILFLIAKGEPSKIDTAKKAVTYGIIGVIVGLIGFSAVTTIQTFIPTSPGGGGAPEYNADNCYGGC